MNLWLSPHGIWYYRKVTTLPCGRRKEIKKSLHTRDKLTARAAVAKLLACVRSRAQPVVQSASEPENPQPQPNIKPAVPAAKPLAPLLSVLSDRYLKEKALSWAPKELSNQKNYIGCFINALGDRPAADYAKADVVKFMHIPVENEHLFRFKMNADSGLRVHHFRTPQSTNSDVR